MNRFYDNMPLPISGQATPIPEIFGPKYDNGPLPISGQATPIPEIFGLKKAAYSVDETLAQLACGRTHLYALVKSGQLRATKLGSAKKTVFLAVDIATFLAKLREEYRSETNGVAPHA